MIRSLVLNSPGYVNRRPERLKSHNILIGRAIETATPRRVYAHLAAGIDYGEGSCA